MIFVPSCTNAPCQSRTAFSLWRKRKRRQLKKETHRVGDVEKERSEERMCLIIQHYPCSLFMALLRQPVEAIYTHTVDCTVKYNSQGKFHPKKPRETRRRVWLHTDKGNLQKQRMKNEMDKEKEEKRQQDIKTQAKMISSLQLLSYHCSCLYLADREIVMRFLVHVGKKGQVQRAKRALRSRSVSFN